MTHDKKEKKEGKKKQVVMNNDNNLILAYEKNWIEEGAGWRLIVDGAWKKVMKGMKEEWEAAYGWALLEKGMEVECGGEKIQAMLGLQAEVKAF